MRGVGGAQLLWHVEVQASQAVESVGGTEHHAGAAQCSQRFGRQHRRLGQAEAHHGQGLQRSGFRFGERHGQDERFDRGLKSLQQGPQRGFERGEFGGARLFGQFALGCRQFAFRGVVALHAAFALAAPALALAARAGRRCDEGVAAGCGLFRGGFVAGFRGDRRGCLCAHRRCDRRFDGDGFNPCFGLRYGDDFWLQCGEQVGCLLVHHDGFGGFFRLARRALGLCLRRSGGLHRYHLCGGIHG